MSVCLSVFLDCKSQISFPNFPIQNFQTKWCDSKSVLNEVSQSRYIQVIYRRWMKNHSRTSANELNNQAEVIYFWTSAYLNSHFQFAVKMVGIPFTILLFLPLAMCNPDARRLYDDLLGDETLYNKNVRPVADHRQGEGRRERQSVLYCAVVCTLDSLQFLQFWVAVTMVF